MQANLRRLSTCRRVFPSFPSTRPLVASENASVPLCYSLSRESDSVSTSAFAVTCLSSSHSPAVSTMTAVRHCSTARGTSHDGEHEGMEINQNENMATLSVEALRAAALKPWQSSLKGDDVIQNVPWVCNERLDFYFSFWAPASWTIQEVVRENFISIQLSPPPEAKASVHGISITAFAYHRKVENPYSPELLKSFTRRFISQVDPSGRVINEVSTTSKLAQDLADGNTAISSSSNSGISRQLREMVEKAGGSVCQMSFAPRTAAGTRTSAKGLCRAFYHPNRRFHYVVLAAVPENEYDLVTPLLSHAVCSASELAAGSDKGTRL